MISKIISSMCIVHLCLHNNLVFLCQYFYHESSISSLQHALTKDPRPQEGEYGSQKAILWSIPFEIVVITRAGFVSYENYELFILWFLAQAVALPKEDDLVISAEVSECMDEVSVWTHIWRHFALFVGDYWRLILSHDEIVIQFVLITIVSKIVQALLKQFRTFTTADNNK